MKKIITAIGNNILKEKLEELENYEVLGNDIQYKEGVLEFLEEKKEVEILVISEILEGEIEFKKLISKILKLKEKLEIIVFIEEDNRELKNFLYEKGIYKIYKNNQVSIDDFKNIIESENSRNTQELAEEVRKLKKIISEQENKVCEKNNQGKVISITGSYGVGKSTLIAAICRHSNKTKNRTLLIDSDIYNKSISVLYNVFPKSIDYINVKNNIIKFSKYENLFYLEKEFLERCDLLKLIQELKPEYDQILIDTSSNLNNKVYRNILEISDEVIFVVVPTLCDLKKAINMFEIIKVDYEIPINKIKLVINKENNYSVDSFIIQKMFGTKVISRKNKILRKF